LYCGALPTNHWCYSGVCACMCMYCVYCGALPTNYWSCSGVCTGICIRMYVYVFVHLACKSLFPGVYACMYINVGLYVCMYTYTHTHIHTLQVKVFTSNGTVTVDPTAKLVDFDVFLSQAWGPATSDPALQRCLMRVSCLPKQGFLTLATGTIQELCSLGNTDRCPDVLQ
jgi:hypothetical protein